MSNEIVVSEQQPAQVPVVQQPMRLIEMALANGADIEKLERLMVMQAQWDARNAKREFLNAMARFQSKCPDIRKSKQGHNYKYAPLADIISQVRELIAECGLSYRFEQNHEKGIQVTCIVSHESGHSESNTMIAMPDTSGSKNAIQAIGSAVQYLMRYTFVGAFGISTADEDMDGRIPEKPQAPADRSFIMAKILHALQERGKSEVEFLAWFGGSCRPAICFQSIDEMTDDQLLMALRKLEAKK